jgi:hypothetical protein
MSLILSGTDGLSDVDGSAATPAIRGTDANTGIFFPAADTIAFSEGGVESMRIDSSGNVGIGTSSPSTKLELNTASSYGGLRIKGTSSASNGFEMAIGSDGVTGHLWLYENSAMRFATNNTERMRIDSSGNVAIGSTTASEKFNVVTSSGSVYTNITNGTGQVYVGVLGSNLGYFGTVSNHAQTFYTNNTERMRIDSSGNAMIGTTTAGLKLTVQAGVTIVSGDQSTCRLVLQNTTSPGRTFSLVAGTVGVGNDDFTIYDNTASATRVTLKADGEFIIGTSDQGAYNLQCNGTGVWGAGAYVNGSDARIKEDIAPIESGLDVVEKLNPVTYRYKEEWSKDQSTQTGFIAQELLTALSGQVYVDGVVQQGGEYMSVAYQNIIPILTKAIQELNAKVEAQAAEITLLKSK